MNHVLNYIDELMVNQPYGELIDSEYSISESDYFFNEQELKRKMNKNQKGGKLNLDGQKGLGGFPPIFMCDNSNSSNPYSATDSDGEKTKREFSKVKGAVSISDVMKQRKEVKPFITLD
jgi:hypothetical protein